MRQNIMKILLAVLLCLLCGAALAEGATETISGTTPLEARFTVPEASVIDASVIDASFNITFDPDDLERLGQIALVSPGGIRYNLWNGRATAARGIGVTQGPSAITLDVHIPEAGEWTVIVSSRDGERVPVHVIPHMNREIRLNLNMRSVFELGDAVTAEAWFQVYNGSAYADMPDGDIYTRSVAELLLYTPGADHDGEPSERVRMAYDGDGRFRATFQPDIVGIWTARVRVVGETMTEELPYIAFEMAVSPTRAPTPTPSPSPTPSPTPEVAKLGAIRVNIDGLLKDEGGNYIDGAREEVALSWTIDGETDRVDAMLMKGSQPVVTGLRSGDTVPMTALEPGQSYTLRLEVMPKNGTKPTVKVTSFAVVPPTAEIGAIRIDVQPLMEDGESLFVDRDAENITISWKIDGPTDSVTAALLEDGVTRRGSLSSGGALPRSLFQDGKTYTVQVSAIPLNGVRLKSDPMIGILSFMLYPEAEPITDLTLSVSGSTLKKNAYRFEGGTARLQWQHSDAEVERYVLQITDSKGDPVVTEALPGSAKSYTAELPKNDDYTVSLTAVPKYARDASMNATATLIIRPHIKNWFEKYWYFLLAGLAALLAGGVAVMLYLRRNKKEKPTYVTGTLHVSCEALGLEEIELKFDIPKKYNAPDVVAVQEGEAITQHPALKELKGTEAHRLLTGVKLSMARADDSGKVEGETRDGAHQPNAPVIRLTSVLPTGAKEMCYVGKDDAEAAILRRRSPDGDFEFLFWGETKPAGKEAAETADVPQDVENPPVETTKTGDVPALTTPPETDAKSNDDWMSASETEATSNDDWMNVPENDMSFDANWMNEPETDATSSDDWMNTPETETASADDWMNTPETETTSSDDWMSAPEGDTLPEKVIDDDPENLFGRDTGADSGEEAEEDKPTDMAKAYAEMLAEHAEPSEMAKAYAALLAEHAEVEEPTDHAKTYAALLAEHAEVDEPTDHAKAYAALLAEHAEVDEPTDHAKAYAEMLAAQGEPSDTAKAYAALLAEHAEVDEPTDHAKAYAALLAEHAEADEPSDTAKAYAALLAEHAEADEPSDTAKAYAALLAEHAEADEPSDTAKAYAEMLAEHAEPSDTAKAYAEMLAEHAEVDEPSDTAKAYAEILAAQGEPSDTAKAYAALLAEHAEADEPSETAKAYAEMLAEHAEDDSEDDEPTDMATAYADFLNDLEQDGDE